MKKLSAFIFAALILTACGNSVQKDQETSDIYKNEKYGYGFAVPEGATISGDDDIVGDQDWLHQTNLYLGGDFNMSVEVWSKSSDVEKIVNKDATNYEPAEGSAGAWFLQNFFFGADYNYIISSSSSLKNDDFITKHRDLVESFEYEK